MRIKNLAKTKRRYATILADPPWHYDQNKRHAGKSPRNQADDYYETATIEDIRNIPVERILQCYMEEAEEVEVSSGVPPAEQSVTPSAENKVPIDLSQNPVLTETKLEKLANDIENKITLETDNDTRDIFRSMEKITDNNFDQEEPLLYYNKSIYDVKSDTEMLKYIFDKYNCAVTINKNYKGNFDLNPAS